VASAGQAPGLIDTDVLIDAARNHPDAVQFLASRHAANDARIIVISAMELLVGCRNKNELQDTNQFLASVIVTPLSESVSLKARELIESFFLTHGLLIPDSLIAATALDLGATLFTKNLKHFQMIPGLAVIRPY
jgi:predicted nucleic acid-binding protein